MRRASWALSLICFLAVAVFPSLAAAQSVTASAGGTVLDATGSAIVGAKVRLLSEGTGALRETVTDPNGAFIFNAIPPGDCTLEVEFTGFKTYRRQSIQLVANDNLALGEIRLEVGAVTESVTVLAEGTSVQTASGERSGVVTSEEVENLTVINRDFAVLVALMPGVVDTANYEVQSFTGGSTYNVLGARSTGNSITVDGLTTENTNAGNANNQVSMDSIQTVKILVSNFQAEFGRKPGAGIYGVTKSGTQQYHGSAYWYKRHEQFNANSFFNNLNSRPETPYRYTTAGATIGGPLKLPKVPRNKLFFFASSEQIREFRPKDIQTVTMPTEMERQGNFSQSLNSSGRLYSMKDPLTGQAFPGNIVPASRVNTNGQNYLKLLPLPNFFNTAVSRYQYNYVTQESMNVPKSMETVRIDYNIDPKTTVYGRFNYWWENQQGWAVSAGNSAWGWLPSTYKAETKTLVLSATRIVSPSLILEGSASVMRWIESGPPLNQADVARLNRKTAGVNLPQFHPEINPSNLVPRANFGGVTNAPNPTINDRFPLRGAETTFTGNLALTKTHRAHVSKLGMYAERWRALKGEAGYFMGYFYFDTDTNNPLDSGYAYLNATLGNFRYYTESSTRPPLHEFTTSLEWFAQDNWRVNRRLTLDVGLRWGWSTPFYSNRREEAGFVPALYDLKQRVSLIQPTLVNRVRMGVNPVTGEILPAALIGAITPGVGNPFSGTVNLATDTSYPAGLRKTGGIRTAPRFGFAYDPFGKGKTAIRGGVGIFYEIHEKDTWQQAYHRNPPRQLNPQIWYSSFDSFMVAPGWNFPGNTKGIDAERQLGRTMNYSFGIQQNIGFRTIVDVSYVGSLGRHLLQERNINSTPLGTNFRLPANEDPANPGRPLAVNFLRPYLGYGDIVYYDYTGNSSYHSLQVSARRSLARSLQFTAAWTWSKTMNYTDAEGYNASNQPGSNNGVSGLISPKIWNYGKAGFDRTHILKLSWIYSVPKASRAWNNIVVKKALDDWQVSGINTFMSGAPNFVSLSWSGTAPDISGSSDGARVVMIANPIIPKSERTFYRNFNTEAFAAPAVGTWGNAPKDTVRGPGINNWDISLFKSFRAGPERLRWQFRCEAYNAFNHTQFSTQNTTAQFNTTTLKQVNAQFGQFTAARQPRRMQLALRLNF